MPWIAPHVFRQDGDPLPDGPRIGVRPRLLVHIVNLYSAPAGSQGQREQAVTTEAMRRAKAFTQTDGQAPDVALVCVCEAGDPIDTPPEFARAQPIERTIANILELENPRPLPLVFDVLERGVSQARTLAEARGVPEHEVAVMFTNSDICPMPHLYLTVADRMAHGIDHIAINRRIVAAGAISTAELASYYQDHGARHGGYDCFVFPLLAYAHYRPTTACLGAAFVARSLLYNMAVNASAMAITTDAHLTFHLGDDPGWSNPASWPYNLHNFAEAEALCTDLAQGDSPCVMKLSGFLAGNNEAFRVLKSAPGAPRPVVNMKDRLTKLKYRTIWRMRHLSPEAQR